MNKEDAIAGSVSIALILAFIGLLAVPFAVTTIDQGERGVKTTFGEVNHEEPLEPGLQFKIPIVQDIHKMSVRTETYTLARGDHSQSIIDDGAMSVKDKSGLNIDLEMSIRYKLNAENTTDIYESLGKENEFLRKMVRPTVQTEIRNAAENYGHQQIYSGDREQFQEEIKDNIQRDFDRHGLEVEKVQIRNVMLPERVESAIRDKEAAEQEIEVRKRQIKVEEAEADRKRAEAEGVRDAENIIAEADFDDRYLQYLWITEGLEKGDTIYVPFNEGQGLDMFKDIDNTNGPNK